MGPLPAGTIGRGEDVIAAVRRVVIGTATIGVSVGWMAGVHSHVHDGLTLVFLARRAAGRITPAGVIQTCCWATPRRGLASALAGSGRAARWCSSCPPASTGDRRAAHSAAHT